MVAQLYCPRRSQRLRRHRSIPVGQRLRRPLPRGSAGGLYAVRHGHLGWRRLETGRRRLTRQLRRSRVKVVVRLNQPLTAKPRQARMGKGKGKFRGWVGYARPGTQIYDLGPTGPRSWRQHPAAATRLGGAFPLRRLNRRLPFGVRSRWTLPLQRRRRRNNSAAPLGHRCTTDGGDGTPPHRPVAPIYGPRFSGEHEPSGGSGAATVSTGPSTKPAAAPSSATEKFSLEKFPAPLERRLRRLLRSGRPLRRGRGRVAALLAAALPEGAAVTDRPLRQLALGLGALRKTFGRPLRAWRSWDEVLGPLGSAGESFSAGKAFAGRGNSAGATGTTGAAGSSGPRRNPLSPLGGRSGARRLAAAENASLPSAVNELVAEGFLGELFPESSEVLGTEKFSEESPLTCIPLPGGQLLVLYDFGPAFSPEASLLKGQREETFGEAEKGEETFTNSGPDSADATFGANGESLESPVGNPSGEGSARRRVRSLLLSLASEPFPKAKVKPSEVAALLTAAELELWRDRWGLASPAFASAPEKPEPSGHSAPEAVGRWQRWLGQRLVRRRRRGLVRRRQAQQARRKIRFRRQRSKPRRRRHWLRLRRQRSRWRHQARHRTAPPMATGMGLSPLGRFLARQPPFSAVAPFGTTSPKSLTPTAEKTSFGEPFGETRR